MSKNRYKVACDGDHYVGYLLTVEESSTGRKVGNIVHVAGGTRAHRWPYNTSQQDAEKWLKEAEESGQWQIGTPWVSSDGVAEIAPIRLPW